MPILQNGLLIAEEQKIRPQTSPPRHQIGPKLHEDLIIEPEAILLISSSDPHEDNSL
jgi:hypothetical protein